jgi:hypothetical protein
LAQGPRREPSFMALHRSGSFDGSGHAPRQRVRGTAPPPLACRQGRLDGRDGDEMFLIRMFVLYMNFFVEVE